MARPQTVVKNPLSLTIAELRRRLGLSQQRFSDLFEVSLNTIARWELNSRPAPEMLKRLIELAMEHGFADLEDVLYAEYQAEFGLKLRSNFNREMNEQIDFALRILTGSSVRPAKILNRDVQIVKGILNNLRSRLKAEFPGWPMVVKVTPKEKDKK